MSSFAAPRGLIAPILTPFNDDLSVATDLYVAHALDLLDQGCAALAPFGTTGEALSVGIEERMAGLEALIAAGIDARRLIPGTGLTNLPDTVRLTSHAVANGCLAAMVLPPFYIKDPPDDGVVEYFGQLISRVGSDALSVVLYHIPQVAGVGFSIDLVDRLRGTFPDTVVGIKDSSGDWSNTRQLFEIEGLVTFPGSELPLVEALALGGSGCISATANLNARGIIAVIDAYRDGGVDGAADAQAAATALRLVFQEYAPIPAQKFLLSRTTGDSRWRNVRPPLMPMSDAAGTALERELEALS